MPDADWPDVAGAALRALQELEEGQLRIEDRQVLLSGVALSPVAAERAELLLADLPTPYSVERALDLLDDGSPLRLTATRRDGAREALTGKLPQSMAGAAPEGEVTLSPLPTPFADWPKAVELGLGALEQLQNGHLAIIGTNLTLTGEAWSQPAYDRVGAMLGQMPAAMSVSRQITLADSGQPFGLRLVRGPLGVEASGKVPQSLAPRVLAALSAAPVDASELQVARIAPGQDWWLAASLGAEALRFLEKGEMQFDGTTLSLTGPVQDPPRLEALTQHLEALPEAVSLTLDLDLIDDGTPLRLALDYDGDTAILNGKLPEAMEADQLSGPLEAPVLPGDLVQTPKPGPEGWAEAALAGAQVLRLFESGLFTLNGTEMHFKGVLRNPARERQVLTALTALPRGYGFSTDLRFQDDGRPFAFRLSFDGRSGVLSGKVPLDLGPASQSAILGFPIEAREVQFAKIPADADWWSAARAGLKALAGLDSGVLMLDAHQVTLEGIAATSEAAEATKTRLAPFQQAFKIELKIEAP